MKHGRSGSAWRRMPAVHWLAERVQRPCTGMVGTVVLPLRGGPAVRPPGAPAVVAVPLSRNVRGVRVDGIHDVPRTQRPLPCS